VAAGHYLGNANYAEAYRLLRIGLAAVPSDAALLYLSRILEREQGPALAIPNG